jgi:hypothetical protein
MTSTSLLTIDTKAAGAKQRLARAGERQSRRTFQIFFYQFFLGQNLCHVHSAWRALNVFEVIHRFAVDVQ